MISDGWVQGWALGWSQRFMLKSSDILLHSYKLNVIYFLREKKNTDFFFTANIRTYHTTVFSACSAPLLDEHHTCTETQPCSFSWSWIMSTSAEEQSLCSSAVLSFISSVATSIGFRFTCCSQWIGILFFTYGNELEAMKRQRPILENHLLGGIQGKTTQSPCLHLLGFFSIKKIP